MPSGNNIIFAPHTGQLYSHSISKVNDPTVRKMHELETSGAVKTSLGVNGKDKIETGSTESKAAAKTLGKLNELANSQSKRLHFYYDKRIDKIVVRIMEENNEEVIRQSLKMDEISGVLLNQNV